MFVIFVLDSICTSNFPLYNTGLDQAGLFTGINYNLYTAPDGFCFDEGCDDPPVMVGDCCHAIAAICNY